MPDGAFGFDSYSCDPNPPAPAPALPATYAQGAASAVCADGGAIDTAEQCHAALLSLGLGGGQQVTTLVPGAYPAGCFLFDGSAQGYFSPHANAGYADAPRANIRPICCTSCAAAAAASDCGPGSGSVPGSAVGCAPKPATRPTIRFANVGSKRVEVATSGAPAPVSTWSLVGRTAGTDKCPAGYRNPTFDECGAAVGSIAAANGGKIVGFNYEGFSKSSGAWSWTPPGCSFSTVTMFAVYNTAPADKTSNDGRYELVCGLEQPV